MNVSIGFLSSIESCVGMYMREWPRASHPPASAAKPMSTAIFCVLLLRKGETEKPQHETKGKAILRPNCEKKFDRTTDLSLQCRRGFLVVHNIPVRLFL